MAKRLSRPTRREDLRLTTILADSVELAALAESMSVDDRISEALDKLRRAPVRGESSEVLVRFKDGRSVASASFREHMEVLAEAVEYDLITACAGLILAPQRSLDLGSQTRVLTGALRYPGDPGQVVIMLRFMNTGGAEAALVDVTDRSVSNMPELVICLEALAAERVRALAPDARVLGEPVSRAAFVLTPATMGLLDDPESMKAAVRGFAAVEGVELVIRMVDFGNQSATRHLTGELAGMSINLVVPWTRTYERVPFTLLPEGTVEVVAADSKEEALDQLRNVLEQHVDEVEAAGSGTVDAFTDAEARAIRASLESAKMRLVVVGGNDRQRVICDRIEGDLVDQLGPGISLSWMSGWGSGGARGALAGSEGVVWSELVGHTLGEAIRREAAVEGIPHTKVVGTGTGRGAIHRAVVDATRAAIRRRGG